MNKKLKKKNKMINSIYSLLIDLPAPLNLSLWWNMGSLLGMCLTMQIISGMILSMHYSPNVETAFESISHIMRNVNYGWMIRNMHANGASMFFLIMYMHIGRSLYYGSFKMWKTWTMGIIILFSTMATAFLGYVLPWGQMSFWGATVITNLMSAMPYIGEMLVKWIWGGFAVSNATISRFFSFHFLLPFIILMMTIMHLMFLHEQGSNNPLGLNSNMDKIPFHPYFSTKDLMGFSMMIMSLTMLNFSEPFMLSDPDNFTPANPMNTPIHIKPEWYFLFAYAILRSIPNKLGGVIALFLSISILVIKPIIMKSKFKSISLYPMSQIMFWIFLNCTILLTWIGARPVEEPFTNLGMKMTIMYFSYFMIQPIIMKTWDKMIK